MTQTALARTLAPLLLAAGAAVTLAAWTPVARAADEPAPPPQAEAPKDPAPAAEAPVEVAPPAEPDRISGKIRKVDPESKSITVLVAPDRNSHGRAYRSYKLVLDDKSLILINQQPSTLSALESGQNVEVGYWKKGKQQVVDTVVVTGKDEE
jgi:hypothetical protein